MYAGTEIIMTTKSAKMQAIISPHVQTFCQQQQQYFAQEIILCLGSLQPCSLQQQMLALQYHRLVNTWLADSVRIEQVVS